MATRDDVNRVYLECLECGKRFSVSRALLEGLSRSDEITCPAPLCRSTDVEYADTLDETRALENDEF